MPALYRCSITFSEAFPENRNFQGPENSKQNEFDFLNDTNRSCASLHTKKDELLLQLSHHF